MYFFKNFRCQLLLVDLCYYYHVGSLLPLELFKANNRPLDPLSFREKRRKTKFNELIMLLVLLILYSVQGLCSLLELEK